MLTINNQMSNFIGQYELLKRLDIAKLLKVDRN